MEMKTIVKLIGFLLLFAVLALVYVFLMFGVFSILARPGLVIIIIGIVLAVGFITSIVKADERRVPKSKPLGYQCKKCGKVFLLYDMPPTSHTDKFDRECDGVPDEEDEEDEYGLSYSNYKCEKCGTVFWKYPPFHHRDEFDRQCYGSLRSLFPGSPVRRGSRR